MPEQERRFVFIDRDGTVNVEKHYLSDPDQLELIPGSAEAIRRLNDGGFGVVLITNQAGVGRGYFGLDAVERVHRRLAALLAEAGARLDAIYFCPHAPDADCQCRKPLPGMIEQAVADFGLRPERSVMIGDKEIDIETGRAVGATTYLVRTGYGGEQEKAGTRADHVADTLAHAIDHLLAADAA